VITWRIKGWAAQLPRVEDEKYMLHTILVEKLRKRECLADVNIDGRIIFKMELTEIVCQNTD
jgi:hypothetical protein